MSSRVAVAGDEPAITEIWSITTTSETASGVLHRSAEGHVQATRTTPPTLPLARDASARAVATVSVPAPAPEGEGVVTVAAPLAPLPSDAREAAFTLLFAPRVAPDASTGTRAPCPAWVGVGECVTVTVGPVADGEAAPTSAWAVNETWLFAGGQPVELVRTVRSAAGDVSGTLRRLTQPRPLPAPTSPSRQAQRAED